MLGFLVFGTIFTLLILGAGAFAWQRTEQPAHKEGGQRRNRGEARQVQAHFDGDEDFARSFQRPTQNEVLETLQLLDHLSPGWDRGDAALVDRRLKNELAESFPSLRKGGCLYPQPIEEDIASLLGNTNVSPEARENRLRSHYAKIASARHAFRSERAQANALHQLTSGAEVSPVALPPGSLPFRVSEEVSSRRKGARTKRWVMAAAAVGLALGCWYLTADEQFRHRLLTSLNMAESDKIIPPPAPKPTEVSGALPTATPPAVAINPTPAAEENTSSSADTTLSPPPTPAPTEPPPAPVPVAVASPPATGLTSATPSEQAAERVLAEQIAESQARAVDKYPDLAVPNSEMNLRFVFRYKSLLAEKSPRLHEPDWPEKLAAECAKASSGGPKTKKVTQAAVKQH